MRWENKNAADFPICPDRLGFSRNIWKQALKTLIKTFLFKEAFSLLWDTIVTFNTFMAFIDAHVYNSFYARLRDGSHVETK